MIEEEQMMRLWVVSERVLVYPDQLSSSCYDCLHRTGPLTLMVTYFNQ